MFGPKCNERCPGFALCDSVFRSVVQKLWSQRLMHPTKDEEPPKILEDTTIGDILK